MEMYLRKRSSLTNTPSGAGDWIAHYDIKLKITEVMNVNRQSVSNFLQKALPSFVISGLLRPCSLFAFF